MTRRKALWYNERARRLLRRGRTQWLVIVDVTRSSERLLQDLALLYGPVAAPAVHARLSALMDEFRRRNPVLQHTTLAPPALTERDAFLIAYGDAVRQPGKPPLRTLARFLSATTGRLLPGLHILPFFPSSSDEGFSVVDYCQVDPTLGDWSHVLQLARGRRLMGDLVLNHVSRSSAWFQAFLRQEPPYDDYFITVAPGTDLSAVVRARTHPLATPVETASGTRLVWTTFSADQVDLNYRNPRVLFDLVDVMLLYVSMGVAVLRLDAIAYLWKEIGTPCIHLPQTHAVVRVLRTVLDLAAPGVLLLTETNVPHAENISYFGNGHDEAHMVYQFALPPLVLDAIHRGDARHLSAWAAGVAAPSAATTFFNFLASHDGIGVRPAEGLLPPGAVEAMAERVLSQGGLVSYRSLSDGSRRPYELNTTYYDALNGPGTAEPQALQVDRFLCSQAILLSLAGAPGIYYHSLLGSRNARQDVEGTGQARSINRRRLDYDALMTELGDRSMLRSRVLGRYRDLLAARAADPAFHPLAAQEVVEADAGLFVLVRTPVHGSRPVLCIHNLTGRERQVNVRTLPGVRAGAATLSDLIARRPRPVDSEMTLPAYGVAWLRGA